MSRSSREGAVATRLGSCSSRRYEPTARPLAFAQRHDVRGFVESELERREELRYPPFSHLVSVLVSGRDAGAPLRLAGELRGALAARRAEILGPAPLMRLRGRHRTQLVVKTDEPRRVAREAARLLEAAAPAMRRDGLTGVVDVDPQSS